MISAFKRHPLFLALILLALLLRLAFVLVIDPHPRVEGGDAEWYMQNGYTLVRTGTTAGPLPTPPLYLTFVGTLQLLIPGGFGSGAEYTHAEMQIVRALQAGLGAALCAFLYLIARRLISPRAGLIAGTLAALSPALIIESGNVTSEGLFMFFMFAALALYADVKDSTTLRRIGLVGALFGLATLTRAVLLLFPLGIAAHLFLTQRARWRQMAAVLLLAYGMVVATWTVYNAVVWDRLVIGSEGLLSFIHQGSEGKASPAEYDAGLGLTPGDSSGDRMNRIKTGIRENIVGKPAEWTGRRVRNLGYAYLQPHNTNHYPGDSVRYAAQDWFQDDRSLAGLVDLTQMNAFWEKLALYMLHFGALLLGTLGMILFRKHWRQLLPLYGVILYFTGIHLVLLALPRYLFPMLPVFGIFGAGVLAWLWDRRSSTTRTTVKVQSSLADDTPLASGDSTS